jgi:hypothetical protein
MTTKQTAVEWLVEQILVKYEDYMNDDYEFDFSKPPKISFYNAFIDSTDLSVYVNKAKQMEKEQIKDAFTDGCIGELYELNAYYTSEKYYNKTYNVKDI